YVSLIGVAYQADHHPQEPCFLGQMRELPWKDVKIGPLKYDRTVAWPKNQGTERVQQETGWMMYDLRDTQRHSMVLDAGDPPQANQDKYDRWSDMAFCSGSWFNCQGSISSKTLEFDLPLQDATDINTARLIYDIRQVGSASLLVNGTAVGSMPGAATVSGRQSDESQWVPRSIDISPALLHAGSNTITINMSGNVAFDRLQFEFGYGEAVIDPLPPNLIIVSPFNGEDKVGSDVDITYYVSGDLTEVANVEFSLDGATAVADNGLDGKLTLTSVPAGSHTLAAWLVDSNGSKMADTEVNTNFTTSSSNSDPNPTSVEWLHVEGNKLINAFGQTVVLRGANVENREWINNNISFELNAIPTLTGAAPNGWGANLVSLAVASGPINRDDPGYVAALDELVALAKENNAYTLIVYRYAEPNSGQPNMPDQEAEDAMAKLAAHFKDEPAVLYGLQVEPHDVSWAELKPRFTTMIDAIQANNPKAVVVVPGTQWSRYIYHQLDDPIIRDNLVLKTHTYDAWGDVQAGYRLDEASAQYPVIIGEFGPVSSPPVSMTDIDDMLNYADEKGISWAAWLFNEVGCPCLLSDAGAMTPADPYGVAIKGRLQAAAGSSQTPSFDVLVYHEIDPDGGFFHPSTPDGVIALKALGQSNGFTVVDTTDSSIFNDADLAQFEAVIFFQTHQDVMTDGEQAAFERYIRNGNGYVGIHIASGTEYDWGWYGGLVGARFNNHPNTQQAVVNIEDPSHPSTSSLPSTWVRTDEWYNFFNGPDRNVVHVLATVDETTYDTADGIAPGSEHGSDHPIAWCQVYDGGRSWYTGMGHLSQDYSDSLFMDHLLGGIQYAAGVVSADCSPTPDVPNNDNGDSMISNLAVASNKVYKTFEFALAQGVQAYIDRTGISIDSVPASLIGASYIQTANDDKFSTGSQFISFDVDRDVVVSVAHDDRLKTKPDWLLSFADTSDDLTVGGQTHSLWVKSYPAGRVELGGNEGIQESSMYIVVVSPDDTSPAIKIGNADVQLDGFATVDVVLTSAPEGIAGFDINVGMSNASVEIVGAVLAPEFEDLTTNTSATVSRIIGVDFNQAFNPGDTNILLATLTVQGIAVGSADFVISVNKIDDDNGDAMTPQLLGGTAVVTSGPPPNSAPSVHAGANATINEGDTFVGSGSFTDGDSSSWSANVNYGDGSGVQNLPLSSQSFNLQHTYTVPGVYTVTVTVTDDSGDRGVDSIELTVLKAFPILPDMTEPAKDLDNDGTAEDVNGNNRLDFADIVLLFEHLESPQVVDNPAYFDYNGNGKVDMADILVLFEMLISS
ncbi:MAG: ThuA domain-containing protein, partial [Chloroflexi bacterium]|nr:ThuA domain-containing protein [Chloroflexota bacterium]